MPCLASLQLACIVIILYSASALHASLYYDANESTLDVLDPCWRLKANWAINRKELVECPLKYGEGVLGGKFGSIYVVTNPSDDPVNPKNGTLRYGVIQAEPLWIIFAKNMAITLKNELIFTSYKTIDGRGAIVEISYGPCFTIQGVSHVIIHDIGFRECKPAKSGVVRSSTTHVGYRSGSDSDGEGNGDAIRILTSSYVLIDYCYFARCKDDFTGFNHPSTTIFITNSYFYQ